jgi:two-component system chemotaxis response regulator CheY
MFMKVLIVDDDAAYRRLLSTILKSKHHEVVEAADGLGAWDLLKVEPFSFVITDWMMPGIDGLELIRRIRTANFPNYTYIILLTAKNAKEDIVGGLQSGADDYLTKPFDLDELRARIAIGERILDLETRLRRTMEQLQILATYDSLTGLLNRRALYEAAANECARSRREAKPLSLVMLDLDRFKDINDKFGHLVGDQALRLVTDIITKHKRNYDLIGRWGGEEFLLVLPGTDMREAGLVAERLRSELEATQLDLPDGTSVQIRASFGVTNINIDDNSTFDKYIAYADRALYRAKNEGRDRVCYFVPDDNRD